MPSSSKLQLGTRKIKKDQKNSELGISVAIRSRLACYTRAVRQCDDSHDSIYQAAVMATATATSSVLNHRTLADLLTSLGGIAADRVRLQPFPGTATESDVIAVHDRENRLCELVDGTLVDKVMGFDESIYAALLVGTLCSTSSRPTTRAKLPVPTVSRWIFPGMVRIPDTAFILRRRVTPSRQRAGTGRCIRSCPDLIVVQFPSKGNTPEGNGP